MSEPAKIQNVVPPMTYSAKYRAWLLFLLVLVYACSFLDRIIIAILARPIKADLSLSDFQLGLLGGLAFALLYAVAGIPMGRMAEKKRRINVISASIVAWSGFAALCGLAQNFWQMVLFRAGVGIGEAGGTPAAHSLIADHFPPERRATALSIYALGVPVGILIASFAGGWLAQMFGWRYTFVVLGLPGMAIGMLTYFTLHEPRRGLSDGANSAASSDAVPPMTAVLKRVWSMRGARHMIIGTTVGAFALQGINQFIPIYLGRVFDMGLAKAGFTFGIIVGIGGLIGIALGGYLSDRLAVWDKRWYGWVPGLATLGAVPIAAYGFLSNNVTEATVAIFGYIVLVMVWNGPTFSVVHASVHPRMRASSTALVLLVISVIGHGMGPAVIGFASDWFATRAFTGAGVYHAACVAGMASLQPGSELAAACAKASAEGIRFGMLSFVPLIGWAGLHYVWASVSLRSDLKQGPAGHEHPSLAVAVAETES